MFEDLNHDELEVLTEALLTWRSNTQESYARLYLAYKGIKNSLIAEINKRIDLRNQPKKEV